jgi:hypothetical protein
MPPAHWHAAAEAIAPYAAQPQAAWILLIPLAAADILRLLMEWQQRLTLAQVFRHAPGGSVIVIRNRGLGGSMWIQVGPPADARHLAPDGTGPPARADRTHLTRRARPAGRASRARQRRARGRGTVHRRRFADLAFSRAGRAGDRTDAAR